MISARWALQKAQCVHTHQTCEMIYLPPDNGSASHSSPVNVATTLGRATITPLRPCNAPINVAPAGRSNSNT